ncbi:hypothetical protein M441DRAFT_50872 [Trichoderma asperellum CBS 433.97]|uniref:Uncharacterized protein n=1 Tax=Trichoderma asperellum (strain ATCC 204424 / CBS 433.97 / NBRC 101777) TaxID=1042311 RepID=A0A2T3YWA2_TRIA4|nr:hypothetical protein M441DRAFT_50872 [Trichoderma asperellum CBS 433.97]PTB36848.1 hypothetical protein M441DRAFT_50872 [Trichoderma asperellum CBS 433.97]
MSSAKLSSNPPPCCQTESAKTPDASETKSNQSIETGLGRARTQHRGSLLVSPLQKAQRSLQQYPVSCISPLGGEKKRPATVGNDSHLEEEVDISGAMNGTVIFLSSQQQQAQQHLFPREMANTYFLPQPALNVAKLLPCSGGKNTAPVRWANRVAQQGRTLGIVQCMLIQDPLKTGSVRVPPPVSAIEILKPQTGRCKHDLNRREGRASEGIMPSLLVAVREYEATLPTPNRGLQILPT